MKEIHPALRPKETVVINLRSVPSDLHRALRVAAMDANMSMENYVIQTLSRAMNPAGR